MKFLCRVVVDVLFRGCRQQIVSLLLRQPFGLVGGTGEANQLTVFCEQRCRLVFCGCEDMVAESNQQQRCPRLHGRRVDHAASSCDGA